MGIINYSVKGVRMDETRMNETNVVETPTQELVDPIMGLDGEVVTTTEVIRSTPKISKLVIMPYLGPPTYCACVRALPAGVQKPVNCTLYARYAIYVNSDPVHNACPQCTTALEQEYDRQHLMPT
jgi:hypothetical protein